MKWGDVLGVTVVVFLIALYEWPKIERKQKKEKMAFILISATGWLLAAMLIFYPKTPGPTQLVNAIFRPLSKLLEK